MFKKIATGAVVLSSIALPFMALAQIGGFTSVPVAPAGFDISSLIDKVVDYIFGIILVIAVILIFYAAFLYLTSAGDEKKVEDAKKYIIYAIIGIVIAFLARAIVDIVQDLLV